MTKKYNCKLCKKEFKQKIDYTRHKEKKTSCITIIEMEEIITKDIGDKNMLNTLKKTFKNILNILRDKEGITGDKALRNLSYFLILKLIEPHLETEIDICNYNYIFDIEDKFLENHKKIMFEIVYFSNLVNEKEDNIITNIKYLWDDILSQHPVTKNIFLKNKGFDLSNKLTFKKIIEIINDLDLSNTSYDILGIAYEEVIQHLMVGSALGQHFTQPLLKNMMVKLIDPKIYSDGTIETCCDPSMGTGGFLITYLKYILNKASKQNIKVNWDYIKTEGLYGKEFDIDTYQLAVSNMLISSGHMFEKLDRGDSIRDPIARKFDNILANPPFGIDGLIYDDFNNTLKNKYTPIKMNNGALLFIQAIIHMLKINGKCAVVLPNGKELDNNSFSVLREYLMKTCDLKEIYYLPSGIFEYTKINTCILYFVKKKEGEDILEVKIKYNKNNKETNRDYIFKNKHQTKEVLFYDYNPFENIKKLLGKVSIDIISTNSYSLNYIDYIEDEIIKYDNNVIIKKLGEICKFLPKSKRQASYGNKEGNYHFYTSSQNKIKYCDSYDYENECIIIGTGGNANIKLGSKFSCSTDNIILTTDFNKYIYYYLIMNIYILERGFKGVGLKHISLSFIKSIKIPIPPIEKQNEIIEYLEHNDNLIKNLQQEIENNKIQANNFMKNIITKKNDCDDIIDNEDSNTTLEI